MTEASSRGLVKLQKLPNGQYEVTPGRAGGSRDTAKQDRPERRPRGGRGRGRTAQAVAPEPAAPEPAAPEPNDSGPTPTEIPGNSDPLRAAYDLLEQALAALKNIGRETVRDSDVKRKMLQLSPSFDESELGFSKFSRFLRQAGDHGIVYLHQMSTGNVQVSLTPRPTPDDEQGQETRSEATLEPAATSSTPAPEEPPEGDEPRQSTLSGWLGRLGMRTGSHAPKSTTGPLLLDGQTVGDRDAVETDTSPPGGAGRDGLDAAALGLPTGSRAMVQYLCNSYGGVGKKTAEILVETLGDSLFSVFQNDPARVHQLVPRRAEQVLSGWRSDYARRTGQGGAGRPEQGG